MSGGEKGWAKMWFEYSQSMGKERIVGKGREAGEIWGGGGKDGAEYTGGREG